MKRLQKFPSGSAKRALPMAPSCRLAPLCCLQCSIANPIVPLPEALAPEYIRRLIRTARFIVYPNEPEYEVK